MKHSESKSRKNRPVSGRKLNASFLIICEGKTEKCYFETLVKSIEKRSDTDLHPLIRYKIRKINEGLINTVQKILVDNPMYKHIWIVFDEDKRPFFNDVIKKAEDEGWNVAWSNTAFELWLLLHFEENNRILTANEYEDKINRCFKRYGIKTGYQKNSTDSIKHILNSGAFKSAMDRAAKLREMHKHNAKNTPQEQNPCTKVDLLVKELLSSHLPSHSSEENASAR